MTKERERSSDSKRSIEQAGDVTNTMHLSDSANARTKLVERATQSDDEVLQIESSERSEFLKRFNKAFRDRL